MAEAPQPFISVIIPALNEEAMIGESLAALAQAAEANRVEVIVVDNGSSDRTIEVARSFSGRLNVIVTQRTGVYVAALRNVGAQMAHGEILAFLDADCVVPSDWLVNARSALSRQSGIIGGYIRIPEQAKWVARAWYGVGYCPQTGEVDYVPSGNLLMRRSQFLEINGFNESLQTAEDFDLCLRARQSGFKVYAIAELAVTHLRTPETIREFYVREKWHGAHVTKALVGNVRQWQQFRAVAFAAYTLACAVGIAVGVVLAFSGWGILPAATFVSALLLAAAACTWKKLQGRQQKRFASFLQLTVLHVVYGLARAHSLVSFGSRYPRTSAGVDPGSIRLEES
jgi:glycosyltransferase involved in cell wall biosynthesis